MSSFCVFCRIACPTDLEMCPTLWLWELNADPMSHLGVISSSSVFERPYNGLAAFINVSWAQKTKIRCMNTLRTFVVPPCQQKLAWKSQRCTKTHQKRDRLSSRRAPGRGLFVLFLFWFFMRGHRGADISKTCSWQASVTKSTWNESHWVPGGPNKFQICTKDNQHRRTKNSIK